MGPLAILALIQSLVKETPEAIREVRDIFVQWNNVDPTGEDFEALAKLAETLRPHDPLKP